ncbi:MAG: HD domain-containing protein [Proteobacteria bacterium]|nr:HD domain-containing protein [Pseudomonadota bacterium]
MDENIKLKELVRLGTELNNIHDVDILLERILHEARAFAHADAGTIYIIEGDFLVFSNAQNDSLQSKLPPGDKLPYVSFKIPINHNSICGYVAQTGEILNIDDVYNIPENVEYRFDSNYDKRANYRTKSMLTIPLKSETEAVIGALQIINSKDENGEVDPFDEDEAMFAHHFAATASMVLQRAQMTRALLLRMIDMARLRDPKETGAHVNRVGAYSVEIYERWALSKGYPKEEIDKNRDMLRMAAMLHDVGKVAISDTILKKPGRFTEDEYEIMKTHAWTGAQLFLDKQSKFDEMAAQVAVDHHENWDGTGYPGHIDLRTGKALKTDANGNPLPKKGEEISIYGRVVSLADVYDALSCRRVYKKAWSEEDVLNEIKKEKGKKFDPEVVDAFFKSLDLLKSIYTKYPDNE